MYSKKNKKLQNLREKNVNLWDLKMIGTAIQTNKVYKCRV
jgi:hypothetical protein